MVVTISSSWEGSRVGQEECIALGSDFINVCKHANAKNRIFPLDEDCVWILGVVVVDDDDEYSVSLLVYPSSMLVVVEGGGRAGGGMYLLLTEQGTR